MLFYLIQISGVKQMANSDKVRDTSGTTNSGYGLKDVKMPFGGNVSSGKAGVGKSNPMPPKYSK
jgi:hypothetical protein